MKLYKAFFFLALLMSLVALGCGGDSDSGGSIGAGGGSKYKARCADGTISEAENSRGMCSSHGGVAEWISRPD